ncbi:hypothetical protein [Nocardia otitidiscaviarum]|uniref:hypothetical protein n=1 Tax=Nocardia otitidiscaviarum TaxID=1823 RepID=UPI00245749FC|nr:hypothetical protein [Nocardia otitidiscaviarum]
MPLLEADRPGATTLPDGRCRPGRSEVRSAVHLEPDAGRALLWTRAGPIPETLLTRR